MRILVGMDNATTTVAAYSPTLDNLVNEVTAFRSMDEFVAALGTPERQMYTPTLSPNSGDSKRRKLKKNALAMAVQEMGYRTF
jgi:hypothetical protein